MTVSITNQIVLALSEVKEVEPANLDITVYDHVSPDAIEELVNHPSDSWRVEFSTLNHTVAVTGDGDIYVDEDHVRSFSSESGDETGE
jgi:hypothetical protein